MHLETSIKDKGFAWLVLVGVCVTQFFSCAVFYMLGGLMIPYWIREYEVSNATISTIGMLPTMTGQMTGPLAGYLIGRLGCRVTHVIGSIFVCVFMAIAAITATVESLLICYGLLSGAGIGLAYISCYAIVVQYFDKTRGLAFAIASSFSSLANFVYPILFERLASSYGWRGALLISSALAAHLIPSGLIMYSPETLRKMISRKRKDTKKYPVENKTANLNEECESQATSGELDEEENSKGPQENDNVESFQIETKNISNQSFWTKTKVLLHSLDFYCHLLHGFLLLSHVVVLYAHTPIHAIFDLRFSEMQGAWLLSIMGICNLFGRLFFGYLAGLKQVSVLYLYTFLLIVSSVSLVISQFLTTFISYAITYAVFGLASMQFGIYPMVLCASHGEEMLHVALGYVFVSYALGSIAGPAIGGYLCDLTGYYSYSLGFAASMSGACILPLLLIIMSKKCKQTKCGIGLTS